MSEECARSILRLIAIVIVMVGLTLAVATFITQMGASKAALILIPDAVAQMKTYSLFGNLAISAMGFGLFALSSKLAAMVVEA